MRLKSARSERLPSLLGVAVVLLLAPAVTDAQERPAGATVHVPLITTAPPRPRPRLGVWTRNFDNGRLRAVIITRVDPGLPATKTRQVLQGEEGNVIIGRVRSLRPGDIISELVETETGRRWTIRNTRGLTQAISALPRGARFEISGYECANRYHSFTAIGQLN